MDLRLIIKIMQLGIILIEETRPLRETRRPFSLENDSQKRKYKTIDLPFVQPTYEPEEERDMLEFQIEIEQLFHKNQLFPRIKDEFVQRKDIDFVKYMKAWGVPEDFGFDLLVQMVLHKRAHLPTLVGILKKHFEDDCQKTADSLYRAAEANLVDWSPNNKQFIICHEISSEAQGEIDRYQYPLPMVVEPRILRENTDTGYYTSQSSVILRNNHHEEDVCLDHLNHANHIKFRLNKEVAITIRNKWKNLDKPRADEELDEYQKRVKAFEKYERTAHDVLDHLGLSTGGEFWLTHRYDKRGRTYCQGYHVNYQAACWNKAVVEFANQEVTE